MLIVSSGLDEPAFSATVRNEFIALQIICHFIRSGRSIYAEPYLFGVWQLTVEPSNKAALSECVTLYPGDRAA